MESKAETEKKHHDLEISVRPGLNHNTGKEKPQNSIDVSRFIK